jgi:hypothetical protein
MHRKRYIGAECECIAKSMVTFLAHLAIGHVSFNLVEDHPMASLVEICSAVSEKKI